MINSCNNTNQNNDDILSTLKGENEDQMTYNGKELKKDDFTGLDSLWISLCGSVTDDEDNKEPHILSCHHRSLGVKEVTITS